MQMTIGPLCGSPAFTVIVFFFNDGLFSWVTCWLHFGWIRAGFRLAVRLLRVTIGTLPTAGASTAHATRTALALRPTCGTPRQVDIVGGGDQGFLN